jgi:hypothetical protein
MGEFKGCQVKFKLDVKTYPCQKSITYGRLAIFFHIKNRPIHIENRPIHIENQPFMVG